MAVIKLTQMGGIQPSVAARALPADAGQKAENLNPGTNEFRPLPADALVSSALNAPNPQTMYRFDRNADGTLNTSESTGWIGSGQVVSVVRQQLNDDTTGRIYYTNNTGTTDLGLHWIDPTGANRYAALPPPTTAPTIVSVNRGYIFTEEVRQAEVEAVLQQAIEMVLANVTPMWVGAGTLPAGWVRRSDFVDPADPGYYGAQRDAIRVFALNPATNQIISTYSSMPVAEAAWVFDPLLEGAVAELPPADPRIPAWAAGHTKWWCINMRNYAEAFDINEVSLKAALLTLKMPGTQDAEPLLDSGQADALVEHLVNHGDKDGVRVRANIDAFVNKINDARLLFDNGGKEFLKTLVVAFRQQSRVTSRVASAKSEFAKAMWEYIRILGTATAQPWYTE